MRSLIRGARLDRTVHLLDCTRRPPELKMPEARDGTRRGDTHGKPDSPVGEVPSSQVLNHSLPQVEQLLHVSGRTPQTGMQQEALPEAAPQTPTYEEFRKQLGDELSRLRSEAMEQGYADGLQTGRDAAAGEYADRLAQLARLLDGARSGFEQDVEGLVDIGAEVVFEAVARIMGREYANRDGIVAVVREVIRHAKDRSRLVVRVSPSDHAELNAARQHLTEGWNAQQVEIVADDRVELGGCLLETPGGNLDGRLEVQLQQLRDALVNARLRRTEPALEP